MQIATRGRLMVSEKTKHQDWKLKVKTPVMGQDKCNMICHAILYH